MARGKKNVDRAEGAEGTQKTSAGNRETRAVTREAQIVLPGWKKKSGKIHNAVPQRTHFEKKRGGKRDERGGLHKSKKEKRPRGERLSWDVLRLWTAHQEEEGLAFSRKYSSSFRREQRERAKGQGRGLCRIGTRKKKGAPETARTACERSERNGSNDGAKGKAKNGATGQ